MARLTDDNKTARQMARRRSEALAAEDDHERDQAKRRVWETNGTRLTREELESVVPWRGCGLPIIDGLGDRPPLMKLTAEERAEYETDDADYMTRHGDCRAHRWSMSGSRTQHCGSWCPPPPLNCGQIEQISRLLSSSAQKSPRELASWRLTLTCDHTAERHQHRSNTSWTTRVLECPECARRRGVVSSERLPDPLSKKPITKKGGRQRSPRT